MCIHLSCAITKCHGCIELWQCPSNQNHKMLHARLFLGNRLLQKPQRLASIPPAIRLGFSKLSHPASHASSPLPTKKRRKLEVNAAGAAEARKSSSKHGQSQQQSQDDPTATWLIVGLGNPGANYDGTRHNIGFMVLDEFAKSKDIELRKLEKSAVLGKGSLGGRQVFLAKPVTFMNNSGEAVSQLARFYKVPSTHILVVADDLDLPVGTVRLRQRGGHGGQNGLRSIIERLGNSQEFPRIKIGIGRPAGSISPAAHVLQPFNAKEREVMGVAIQEAVDVIGMILDQGLHKAMSRGGTPSKKGGEKAKGTAAKGAKGEAPAAGKAGSTPAKAPKPLAGPSEVASLGQS
ncbi:peptidyl-tRNA hydrolase [Dunaliella salina]|uniref:peptidyl-tRNA hydrolase n=1 Tax=Dunaliella salina TaxID=3046 RepID=A0ABQ7H068_DUNSA|nr:peptidyl-tRNA hydrolase [Dunaliella salina]|eukprot:KAF5840243.1 peptidyl-tRNA hydrolase [Dunaliella salina]